MRSLKKQVDVRITANTIECFHRGRRIASHQRSSRKARHTTVTAHMPESHRQAGEWSPERLERWAMSIGSATARLVRQQADGPTDTRSRPTAVV